MKMKIILFTNARDERFIREWTAHHLLLGFDKIIIFDHKSIQPIKKELTDFGSRVTVLNVGNMQNPIKLKLMSLAVKIGKYIRADWILYLDADEFLILHRRLQNVHALLSFYDTFADSVAINWLMFGSNYQKNDPVQGTFLETYTKSESKLNPHVKTFVRPTQVTHISNPHFYHLKNTLRSINSAGKQTPNNSPFVPNPISYKHVPAYIAHYFNQSEESYLRRKVLLPMDDTGTFRQSQTTTNVQLIHDEGNVQENVFPKERYAEKIKLFLNKLLPSE